jgi:hypothetical protein
MDTEKIIYLDTSVIHVAENVRYSIRPGQVEQLAADITAHGGIHTPGEVEDLGGGQYRLTVGHVRFEAIKKLNANGAGLSFPVVVRPAGDAATRLRRQLSENLARTDMSLMDCAVTIKRLLEQGTSKKEVCALFSKPTGKKGELAPASNAWVNIVLSALSLPKGIQDQIHAGLISFSGVYALSKVPAGERAAVVTKALAARQKEMEIEESEEGKLAKAEEKAQERKDAITEAEEASAVAAAALEAAQKAVVTAKSDEKDARRVSTPANYHELTKEQQKALAKAIDDAKANVSAAEKAEKTATATLTKANKAVAALVKKASERKPKAKPKPKTIKDTDIAKAAKESGVEATKPVALKAAEMRAAVKDLEVTAYPTVTEIAKLMTAMFDGTLTPKQVRGKLAELVKEPNRPAPSGGQRGAKRKAEETEAAS